MPLLKEKMFTIDYIESLPEGRRAELIDGYIYDLSAPSDTHQRISMNLSADILFFIRKKNDRCQVRHAPFAVYLNSDEYNYFEPDISIICDPDKLDEKGCHGAPDWIIEILSPSTKWKDSVIKLNKYRTAGVREYWIVDPEKRTVRTYNFIDSHTEDYSFEDSISSAVFPDFSIRIGDY